MSDLDALLDRLDRLGGSDLHLSPGHPPLLRVDGALQRLDAPVLTAEAVAALLHALGGEAIGRRLEAEKEFDFAAAAGAGRLRVNVFRSLGGVAAALRRIPETPPDVEALGLPPAVVRLSELNAGLVLVAGATGSGKSTTLAALVARINATRPCHILTIEDPVEFVHRSQRALVSHRELGSHTDSFAAALRAGLREDPDVILVGELRDRETIALALTAAETGHLVLGTLHASSAPRSVDRIVDVFPAGDKDLARAMLAGSLQAVVAQALLPRPGGGRVAAFEILIGTPAVRNLIRESKVPQLTSLMQMGQRFGMTTLRDSLDALVRAGNVEPAAVRALLNSASSPEEG